MVSALPAKPSLAALSSFLSEVHPAFIIMVVTIVLILMSRLLSPR